VIADVVEALLGRRPTRTESVNGGSICQAFRVELPGGDVVFAKTHDDPPADFFEVEAAGLTALAAVGAPAPDVLAVGPRGIVLPWIEPGRLTAAGAAELGRRLADLHAHVASRFGTDGPAFIGELRLPRGDDHVPNLGQMPSCGEGDCPRNDGDGLDWAAFYANQRVLPFARQAHERGALSLDDLVAIERLCDRLADLAGPPEPPALLHGDLWSGNVHAGTDGRAWLIDPAFQGGHRETDVAMLLLFGTPHSAVLDAYTDRRPLAEGWRDRVPLHQLHPLLVHAVLFGAGYGRQAAAIARRHAGPGRSTGAR
jgi:fructosamine-3-kinase